MFPSCHIAVITALMLSISGPVMAQSDGGPVWPTRTAEEMAVTPSPEVASLGGYTDPTVDLATGQGSLKYDLLQWDTGNYSLNIGLSYRIGAFTTEDEAGWVGLGWNLTGGGAVTRTVMGQPDEKQTLDIRTPQSLYEADNKEAVDYIKDLFDLRKDAMTDRYNYYFPGGSGSFIIRNGEIVQLPRSDNKIEIIGEVADKVRDFRVTVSDGTMYEFTEREMSEYRYRPESFNFSDPVPNYRAVTAWHLSRIITPEGGDTIRFSYAVIPQWTRNHNRPSETISMRDGDEHPKLQWLGSGVETGLTINETVIRNRKIIKSISSRTGRVEFTHTAPSQGSMYLSGARLCNFRNNVVKTVSFNRTTTSPELLSSFSISGNDGTFTAKEEFQYNGSGSGRYGDIFGYPNGTSVNGINSAIHPETGMLNPRWRPNFIYAQARALKKTISSLGVVTDYVYEPNSIPFTPRKPRLANRIRRDSLLLGIDPGDGGEPIRPWPADSTGTDDTPADTAITIGIRLKSITATDRVTNVRHIRSFSYADGISNIDFSQVRAEDFVAMSGLTWFKYGGTLLILTFHDTSATMLYGSRLPGATVESARIYYGKVTESVSGTVVREGGHCFEYHKATAEMVQGGFHNSAAMRGLRSLPVAEMWILDGADTLQRRYEYGRFPAAFGPGLTRPTAITTLIPGNAPIDVQRALSYSRYGRPMKVTQTGRPVLNYSWGYGGDLLMSVTQGDVNQPDDALTSEFDYEPLVGCTMIKSPSGRTARYSYSGNRLAEVKNTASVPVARYDYEIHAQTQGYAGTNRIRASELTSGTDNWNTVSRYFSGFGTEMASVREGFGSDGQDVASVTRLDALMRPVARWTPLPLSAQDLLDALRRDNRLSAASMALYGDPEGAMRMTYPGSADDMAETVTAAGAPAKGHPARSERTCSSLLDPQRRATRWKISAGRPVHDGLYGRGELDVVRSTDADGRTLLQRSVLDDGSFADTYYIPDGWGNPLMVLPPEASARLSGEGTAADDAVVADFCYVYSYDRQLRLRSKKMPGCEPVRFAYDRDGRLAYTRDGNQAQNWRRSFMLYDALGRTVMTGTCGDALSDDFWDSPSEANPPMTATRTADKVRAARVSGASAVEAGYSVATALAGILSDPQTGESLKTPYLSNVSPTAYCAAEPVNLIDPTGMSPIYSTSGIFLGCSSEGFTGDIIIYLGDELFDFHRYTSEQLLTGRQWDFVLYDDFRNTNLMKPGAISNIWTHIIGYFNKLCVFDEVFSIDKIEGSIIRLQQRENANWATYLCSNSLPEIIGTNNYKYESTVENIASSLIVHEWYSHGMKGVLDNLKSHRLAYKAVINFKPFWKNTTECYKSFVLQRLYDYTVKETGKNQVDKPYRRLYYKYCKSKE